MKIIQNSCDLLLRMVWNYGTKWRNFSSINMGIAINLVCNLCNVVVLTFSGAFNLIVNTMLQPLGEVT